MHMNMNFDIENKGQTQDFGLPQPEATQNDLKNSEIELLIDWFQFTIFPSKKDYVDLEDSGLYNSYITSDKIIPYLFFKFFKVSSSDVIRDSRSNLNGYNVIYSYRDISIMLNSDRPDMGVNVLLTGCGCRCFESLGLIWYDLFSKIFKYEYNINRLDIAVDLFTNKYFTISLLKEYVSSGLCSSRFRTTFEMTKRDIYNGFQLYGETVQFGSKANDLEITFYDKLLERENAGYIVDNNIKFWTRCELRFRHDKAKEVYLKIYNLDDYTDYIKSILYYYIDFKSKNSSNKQKCRRPTVQWWSNFIGNVYKVKLSTKTREHSIVRSYNWLLSDVSKSQFMVYFSLLNTTGLDKVSIDLLYELVSTGVKKINDKDLKMINDYRLSKQLPILTTKDIYDYLQLMKDEILIGKKND